MAGSSMTAGFRAIRDTISGLMQPPRPGQAIRLKALPRWAWPIAILAVVALPFIVTSLASGGSMPPSASPGLDAQGTGWVSSTWLAVNVLIKFGLVIGLLYAILYVVRRWRGGVLVKTNHQLAVLETTHLSPRQALHLVRVGDQLLLIGATDQSLTFLADVNLPAGLEMKAEAVKKIEFAPFLNQAVRKI